MSNIKLRRVCFDVKYYLILQACFALMPRKTKKTEKQPLRFLERPVGEARVQIIPDVRAAINPKDFFSETQRHNGSSLNSWVSPQFDTSVAAALPLKRGRRKCHSSTSIISQLSRKSSVCKFPSLLFEPGSREQFYQSKHAKRKTASESTVVSNHLQGSAQIKSTICNVQNCETPKRQLVPFKKDNLHRTCSQSGLKAEISCISAEGPLTPAPSEGTSTDLNNIGPLPDVDTPKVIQDYSCPCSQALKALQSPPCSSHCKETDILVPDTPERDYGVKVTWRRRRELMLLLKERGHLSDSDAVIHI